MSAKEEHTGPTGHEEGVMSEALVVSGVVSDALVPEAPVSLEASSAHMSMEDFRAMFVLCQQTILSASNILKDQSIAIRTVSQKVEQVSDTVGNVQEEVKQVHETVDNVQESVSDMRSDMTEMANRLDDMANKRDGTRPSLREFTEIMLKTPFKPYVLGKGGEEFPFKNNDENFILVEASYWKKLMGDIRNFFPDAVKTIPVPEKVVPVSAMTQYWSIVATSTADDRTPTIHNLSDRRLSYEERSAMPATGYPWWREAYASGAADYFEMPMDNDDNDLKHVVDGAYGSESWVRTFDKLLAVRQMFEESEDDEDDDDDDQGVQGVQGVNKKRSSNPAKSTRSKKSRKKC